MDGALAKILLADDSTHAQRMGKKILTAEGHEVSTVSNGQAAIHALEQSLPELVIADIFMPGKNGYEVCHYIKSDEKLKRIPVLLIIGAMEPYDPEEGRRAGADGLITKPLESSSLVNTVKDLLAAAKRFAPARATPKETAPGEVGFEEAPAVEATPQWEEMPEELITPLEADKLEISHEIGQQPIGMLSDFMGMPETAAPPEVAMEPGEAPGMQAPMGMPVEAPLEASSAAAEPPEPEITEPASLLPDPGTLPQLDIAENTVWTAQPAEMTSDEAKLFEQPSANWGDLEQLVEQSAAEQPAPAPLPWQMPSPAPSPVPSAVPIQMAAEPPSAPDRDPALEASESDDAPVQPDSLLEVAEHTEAEAGTDSAIEHYESLDAVVEAQGPVTYKGEPERPIIAPEILPGAGEESPGTPWSGPVEELEAEPSERNLPAVEQLVRQAIEDLMPEIIDRVKQSLKS